jgi:hypothetical protein
MPKLSVPYDEVLEVTEEKFLELLTELQNASYEMKSVLGSPFIDYCDGVVVVTVYNDYQE